MLGSKPFDVIPIWAVYILIVLVGLFVVEIGYRLGTSAHRRNPDLEPGSLGTIVGATLALLAFLLAFLVGIATNHYDARRMLVVDEANAIETAFLRAGYLPAPDSSEIRTLLKEYVGLRIQIADPAQMTAALARSVEIHAELWSRAQSLAQLYPDSEVLVIFVNSLNDLIDLHTKRAAAITLARIPTTIYLMLLSVSLLSLGLVGYENGLTGKHNMVAILILILVFAAVMLLIVDLDRPWEGLLNVSQQPFLDLQTSLKNFR